jgi:hypothetical protein
MKAGVIKPSYGLDDDEEITSEHRLPVVTAAKPPAVPQK